MKTLHLTNCWHPESGGIATFYRELMRQAEVERRQIRLVVPGAADAVESHGEYGRIYSVRSRKSPFNPEYRTILPIAYLLPGAPLRRIIEDERPDALECCDKYTLNYLGGLLRIGAFGIRGYRPAVIGLTCERMDDNVDRYLAGGSLAKAFSRLYMKWLYFPLCDHHIAVSAHTAGELHEVSSGHRVRRGVWVRPMGADCRLFTPERRSAGFRRWLESSSGAPEGATVLLYAGRLAAEKNLDLLIETMRALEQEHAGQFHLVIAGAGSLRESLERRSNRDLPGAVHFFGHVRDRAMLADIYANCDALIHPNPREPFGIALLEAMASGLPVIGPNAGGVTSYGHAGNALLADPSPESFAAAALRLRRDEDLRGRLRVAGRETAERFDWPDVAASFFRLYDELHAVVRGARQDPAMAPAFYSTDSGERRHLTWESEAKRCVPNRAAHSWRP